MTPIEPRAAFIEACRADDLAGMKALLADAPGLALEARPLIEASARGAAEVVRLLLSEGADPAAAAPRATPQRPLFQCLAPGGGEKHGGHVEVIRLLVAAGADLEAEGAYQSLTPLRLAAVVGSRALVERLLVLGARVDVFAAAMIADTDALALMLDRDPAACAARDAKGRQPLHALGMSRLWEASVEEEGRLLACARLLLAAGADLDAPTLKSDFCPSPLWWAISSGRCTTLALLFIALGARLDGALAAAAWQGNVPIMAAILDRGAPVDGLSNKGCTALHDCLLFGRSHAVPFLVDRGADPNLTTPQGHTALHLAAATNQPAEIVRLLLAAGAAPEIEDGEGRAPLDIAIERGHDEVAAILQGA